MTSPPKKPTTPTLPRVAREHLRTRKDKKAKAIVARLYDWMEQEKLEVESLGPWHVDQVLELADR